MRHIIPFVCLLIVSCQSAITHVNYLLARDTTRVQIAEQRQVSGCNRIGVITASDGHSSATDENVSFGSRERALRRLKQKALIHHGDTLVVEPGEIVRTTSHSEGEEVFVSGTVFQCREDRAPTTTAPNHAQHPEFRIVESFVLGRAVKAELQQPMADGEWKRFATWGNLGCLLPWVRSRRIVKNKSAASRRTV